jgi:predicted NACHT family NTPase
VVNEGRADKSGKELDTDFDESIKKYLKKIIAEDSGTGVSDVYTELSAKEILPINLKFRDKKNDKEQDFEVLKLVKKEEKLIITGESGFGKTTTLKWLNFTFATGYLEKKEGSIPLYVELNSYTRGSFHDYFKQQIKKKGLSESILKTLLEGKAIILLDGFDLLSPDEKFYPYDEIYNFVSECSNCRYVISSRPGFFESIKSDFKVSELEKLTDEKILTFIERYVEEKELAEVLKNKILGNQKLKSILTNPMMLYLAIKVAVERKRSNDGDSSTIDDLFPQNSSDLYEIFVSDLFKHHQEKRKPLHADRAQIENALTDLYFKLQCRNEVSCKYNEALQIVKKHAEGRTFRMTTSQDILEDSIELGLMKRNDSEIGYGIHQSFQEYFAAIKLKELFEAECDISEAFSHPKWEEVIIFTSEMMNSDLIDEFVDSMLLKGEFFFASKCANRASEKIKEKLCALLTDKMDSRYELEKIKIALAHPAASNGVCSRHRS